MRFVGAHFGKNSSVAIINEEGNLDFFAQCERFKRVKDYGGFRYKMGKPALSSLAEYFPDLGTLHLDDFCVISGVSSGLYHREPIWRTVDNTTRTSRWVFGRRSKYNPSFIAAYEPVVDHNFIYWTLGRNPDASISHHLASAIASYCFRQDDSEHMFISSNSVGINANSGLRSSLIGSLSSAGYETYDDALEIPPNTPLTALLGDDSLNKVVALSGFLGNVQFDFEDLLRKTVKYSIHEFTHDGQFPRVHEFKKGLTRSDREYVVAFYRWYLNRVLWPPIKKNIEKYRPEKIVLSGSSFSNIELTTRVHDLVGDVTIGPAYDESGLALGAAAFAFFHQKEFWPRFTTPSLQSSNKSLVAIGPQTQMEIARKLANGSIVALIRDKAEIGPNALGFRTILCSAKNKNNKRRLSLALKKHQYYQPLSCMVTIDQFSKFFSGPKGRYMEYQVKCTDEAHELIPAVIHKNGTARPQVVYKSDHWLYKLLKDYGKISGVECLATSSLNNRHNPICNSLDDVDFEMKNRNMEIVCISSQNKPKVLM